MNSRTAQVIVVVAAIAAVTLLLALDRPIPASVIGALTTLLSSFLPSLLGKDNNP